MYVPISADLFPSYSDLIVLSLLKPKSLTDWFVCLHATPPFHPAVTAVITTNLTSS